MNKLTHLFNPTSVAMYGASNNPIKPSGRPLRYLIEQEFKGAIYPINPKYDSIQGLKCYPDVKSIPAENIDLVIIGIPAIKVLDALTECAEAGVKSAVILTSGFGELGEEGRRLQSQLTDFSQKTGMRLLGPNCLGMINLKEKIPATFTTALEDKEMLSGSIAFLSQSGAFGAYILAMARSLGIGFNYWVTTGNEADIQLNDCIQFAACEESTKVIAGYMEDARDGEKLMESLDLCLEKEKPVILLKVGQTESGSKAASSHTGALAGSAEVYKAVFAQKGVIEATDVYELLDFASICAQDKKPKGGKIGVITMSGGAGVLIADKCEELGLAMATLSEETTEKLQEVLPSFASVVNPVDMTGQVVGDPALFKNSLEICLNDPNVDILIVLLGLMKEVGKPIVDKLIELSANSDKLMVVTWVAGPDDAISTLRANNILVYPEPVQCVKAINAAVRYARIADMYKQRREETEADVLPSGLPELKSWLGSVAQTRNCLSENESRKVLQAFGIPVVEGDLAQTPEEAATIAATIGYPVVLKIDSYKIPHKTDIGGVVLNIGNQEALVTAYSRIMENVQAKMGDVKINGMLVQKMAGYEAETLVGLKYDSLFGPTIAFGLGGIFVEVFKDISLRFAPLTRQDAEIMVRNIKGFKILDGQRGRAKCDIQSIVDLLLKFSQLALELKDFIMEVDINPLFVLKEGDGVKAGDALIILK